MQFGPPLQLRFNEEEASELIVSAGFKIGKVREDGPYHYVIDATPKS